MGVHFHQADVCDSSPCEEDGQLRGIKRYLIFNCKYLSCLPVECTMSDKCNRQLTYLLSHLLSVVEELEPTWVRAFLKRTRLLDPDFEGDVLAVISECISKTPFPASHKHPLGLISTTLKTGNPLPQVTPCPLLNRFIERHHGFGVIHQESEDDLGLPKTLTIETLESLQYL